VIRKFDPTGILLGTLLHGESFAQGCVVSTVDGMDHVWVAQFAHYSYSKTVGHLLANGTWIGNVEVGDLPTGVAVDRNGKIWSTNFGSNSLSRIDPAIGPIGADSKTRIGLVDLTVDLGAGAGPQNFSDMTGKNRISRPKTGAWTVVYSGPWKRLAWTADVPTGTSLTVQARSPPKTGDWVVATNGEVLALGGNADVEIQVRFTRDDPNGNSPVLHDLTVFSN
jgi:hypothetical protein